MNEFREPVRLASTAPLRSLRGEIAKGSCGLDFFTFCSVRPILLANFHEAGIPSPRNRISSVQRGEEK